VTQPQTMDKVQKHNSLNTNNTPSSESYKNYLNITLFGSKNFLHANLMIIPPRLGHQNSICDNGVRHTKVELAVECERFWEALPVS
jgi:hypothetical protein